MRSTITAQAVAMKAASVPALASSAISVSGRTPAITAAMTPVSKVTAAGTPRGLHASPAARQQAVARHGEEDPALAEHEDHDHRRQGEHRRPGDQRGGQRLLQLAQDEGQRLAAGGEDGERRGARAPRRPRPCRWGAEQHRADDADGQVALRVLGLLGRRRDGVEAVEGEEDDRRGRAITPSLTPVDPCAAEAERA